MLLSYNLKYKDVYVMWINQPDSEWSACWQAQAHKSNVVVDNFAWNHSILNLTKQNITLIVECTNNTKDQEHKESFYLVD